MNTNINPAKVTNEKSRKSISNLFNGIHNVNNCGYLFILPFIIIFIIFSIYPIFRTLYLSFTDFNGFGDANFISGANYSRLIGDNMFFAAFGNTLKIWGVNIVLQLGLAFLFSSLLDWQYGSVNQILINMGIISTKINWLGQPGTAQIVVGVIGSWMWFGNSFIILMAGVQGIPRIILKQHILMALEGGQCLER